MKLSNLLTLKSADELEAAPVVRAGSAVPSFAESAIHAAADAALDRLNSVLGVPADVRDAFLKGPDGSALRNVLRRYVMHANASSMEPEK